MSEEDDTPQSTTPSTSMQDSPLGCLLAVLIITFFICTGVAFDQESYGLATGLAASALFVLGLFNRARRHWR